MMKIERSLMEHQPWLLCLSSKMGDFARAQFSLPDSHLVSMMNGIDLAHFDPHLGKATRAAICSSSN